MASRVPEPMDGCAVRNASPINTIFLKCQFSLSTRRQRRQIERLLISGISPSASANTVSASTRRSSSDIVSMPVRVQASWSTSATNVLIAGLYR